MASMLFRDYDFGATVYNNHIYVVSATSSQRYDCTKNTWEEIATLQHPRYMHHSELCCSIMSTSFVEINSSWSQ